MAKGKATRRQRKAQTHANRNTAPGGIPAPPANWGVGTAKAARKAEKKLRAQTGGEALAVRLDRACEVYMADLHDVTDEDLAATARLEAMKTLWYLKNNPEVWTRASVKDLASVFGTLIDKSQLLRGEPTQITRLEDVKKMDELGAMLVTEMKRRGEIIDVTPEVA